MRKFEVEIDLPAQELEEFETGDISYIQLQFLLRIYVIGEHLLTKHLNLNHK